jgi:hypothetical protein
MTKQTKASVKGLANIGALLDRGVPAAPATAPKRERRDTSQIFQRTREKIYAAIPLGANLDPKHKALIETYLKGAIGEAYNCGHADALEQNSAVESLLDKQYEARTKLTLPTAVAAIMEQRGLATMTLDLEQVATVFERQHIDFSVAIVDESTSIVDYRLTPIGEI